MKDKQRSSKELGFTITGYSQKNCDTGDTIYAQTKANIRKRLVPETLKKLLSVNNGEICEEAVVEIKRQLEEIYDFFANRNVHEVRGASIFLVICPR